MGTCEHRSALNVIMSLVSRAEHLQLLTVVEELPYYGFTDLNPLNCRRTFLNIINSWWPNRLDLGDIRSPWVKSSWTSYLEFVYFTSHFPKVTISLVLLKYLCSFFGTLRFSQYFHIWPQSWVTMFLYLVFAWKTYVQHKTFQLEPWPQVLNFL